MIFRGTVPLQCFHRCASPVKTCPRGIAGARMVRHESKSDAVRVSRDSDEIRRVPFMDRSEDSTKVTTTVKQIRSNQHVGATP
jgi:hypothetical protein